MLTRLNKVKRDQKMGGGDLLHYGTNHYEVPNDKHSHCNMGVEADLAE